LQVFLWVNHFINFSQAVSNKALVQWAKRKYKKLDRGRTKAENWLGKIARNIPKLFVHWQMGILPTTR
jgi:RNA-directed DNA polymerase